MRILKTMIVLSVLAAAPAIAQVHIGSWQLVDGILLKGQEAEPPLYAINGGGSKTGFFSIQCKGGHYALGGVCGIDRRAGRCVEGRGALRFMIDGNAGFEVIGSDMIHEDQPTPLSAEQVSALSHANRSIVLDEFGKATIALSVLGTSQAFAALAAACAAPNWAPFAERE
jgi:hypothetical protein